VNWSQGDTIVLQEVWQGRVWAARRDVSTLSVLRAGDWHALWTPWQPDGTHWGWYVNLQQPFARTRLGFETMDLAFEVFVERGVFDAETAARIREEALQLARRAERNEPPFDESPPRWPPHPTWKRPELPEGWDQPCR
jgi:hypothetical protein